jgi:phosphoribosylaminoimidazolecarboxamide formyltransferase / IMP cyclohydrolase
MAIRDAADPIYDMIPVDNVLVSVYEKHGIEDFISGLVEINPDVRIISTDETYAYAKRVLRDAGAKNTVKVSEYTGVPEMEGGLLKTLHPKIIAGIVGERNNPEHRQFLTQTLHAGVFFDMVVANPYPFEEIATRPNVYFEMARSYIDFGGRTLIEAAAFNFLGCAVVFEPSEYQAVLEYIGPAGGYTTLSFRRDQAIKAFSFLQMRQDMISRYIAGKSIEDIKKSYRIIPKR